MRINGNLVFNSDGSGVIENLFAESYAGGVGGGSLPAGHTGRLI